MAPEGFGGGDDIRARAETPPSVPMWTTLMLVDGTYPDRPVMSCGSTTTSQVRTIARPPGQPVVGCLVPGGFWNGRRT